MSYKVINLQDIYNVIGESKTKDILKEYNCELNADVEYYLREKAIEFSKQDISKTFLVLDSYKSKDIIVGYFAITNKTTIIKKSILSNSKRKKISRYSKYNNEIKGYNIALPLIGQIGKNYTNKYNELIKGDILLKLACNKIKEIQNTIGGRYVLLECEDKSCLREFYESNGFECIGKRNLEKDELDKNTGKYLLQMIKDLSKYTID